MKKKKQIEINVKSFLDRHDPIWEVPAKKWEQGLPLGNGAMGCVIWNRNPLCFTLDHNSFWIRSKWRPDPGKFRWSNFKKLKKEGKYEGKAEIFSNPIVNIKGVVASLSKHPSPSRIPPSRLELKFSEEPETFKMSLELFKAAGKGSFRLNGKRIKWRAMIPAKHDVFVLEMDRCKVEPAVRFCTDPEFAKDPSIHPSVGYFLKQHGFKPPVHSKEGTLRIFCQEVPDGGELCLAWCKRLHPGKIIIYAALGYGSRKGEAKLKAVNSLNRVKGLSFDALFIEHRSMWKDYYRTASLSIPDTRLEALYWMETYKLRCVTRPDSAAIGLQGVWSPDGKTPPWSGDYHHDMNVEMSYWPVYTGNKLDIGESLYGYIERARPVWRKFCKQFFEREGEFVPVSTDIDGNSMYCSPSCQFQFEHGPWLAHMMWLHWLYSQDKTFLRERAFPFMRSVMTPLMEELKEGRDGLLHLELSASAEYYGRGRGGKMWGPDATIDLAFIKWLAGALIATCKILYIEDAKLEGWKHVFEKIKPYSFCTEPHQRKPGNTKSLAVRGDLNLESSHRHHSHLIPIYPLKTLLYDGDDESRELIDNSLFDWICAGHGEWHALSFPWAAAICAVSGRAELARSFLLDYLDRIVEDSSFMLGGAREGGEMIMYGSYAMTLETGFGFMNAIQEMLLQSHGKKIRVFPAMPEVWGEVVFHNLRAEGAFLVSAKREKGSCSFVRIFSEVGGEVAIKADFGSKRVKIFDSNGKLLTTKLSKEMSYGFKEKEEIWILPETRPIRLPIIIEPIAGREYEKNYFGCKKNL